MPAKKKFRRSADAIAEAARRTGHTVVDVRLVGQDPGDGCVRCVAVVRSQSSSPVNPYCVADVRDWTRAYSRKDRALGAEMEIYAICQSYGDAQARAVERHNELLTRYTWYAPGTKNPVPGCRQAKGAKA